MALEAPAILVALEQSALGTAIRQSVWIYPAANTVHILGLTLLAASVAPVGEQRTVLPFGLPFDPRGEERRSGTEPHHRVTGFDQSLPILRGEHHLTGWLARSRSID